MKILVFAGGGDIGGGKTHILSLTKRISEIDDVKLVSFRNGEFYDDAVSMGIDTVVVPHTIGFFASLRMARKIAKEYKPDIIHCHGTKANIMGIVAKMAAKVPIVTTVHSDPKLDYMGRPLRAFVLGNMNQIAHQMMDYYIAVSDGIRDMLLERSYDPFNLFTVFNGLDFSKDVQKKEKDADDNTIVVGIAARFNPVKDIPTLIRGFAVAYEKNKNLRLHLAGEGQDEDKLKTLCAELGVQDAVEFCGWQKDVEPFYQGLDINVLCSLSEAFPYSLLEGAYYYCPAIATNVGGIPHLIEHEKTGFLFTPGDFETLAKYILELAEDAELRKKFAVNLRNKSKEKFSMDNMVQTQQYIYDTILRREKQKNERKAVVISGAYGKGNSGDEAVLKAIINQIKDIDIDAPCYVMTRTPKKTSCENRVRSIYTFNIFKFWNVLNHSKLFISGGGSLIQDVSSTRSLYYYLYTIKTAKKHNAKVLMYGCGIGPVNKQHNIDKTKKVLSKFVDMITVRDSMSYEFLINLGIDKDKMLLTADPALSLAVSQDNDVQSIFIAEQIPADKKFAVICLREWNEFSDYDSIRRLSEYVYENYGLISIFYPIEVPLDVKIAHTVADEIKTPFYVCHSNYGPEKTIGLFSKAEIVIGMRLHSLIFSVAGHAPVIALSYDPKVEGFMKDMGLDLIINVSDLNFEDLKRFVDDCLTCDTSLINQKMELLCEKQEQNKVVLKQFLES